MAVIKEIPGLTVTINVAGRDLHEYDDNDEEDVERSTSYKYVEAISGAKFSIGVQFDSRSFLEEGEEDEYVRMVIYLDGRVIRHWNHPPFDIVSGRQMYLTKVKTDTGDSFLIQKFSFAELNITEDEPDRNLWGQLGDLGTITIDCFRGWYDEVYQPPQFRGRNMAMRPRVNAPEPQRDAILENSQVAEKNLKGRSISHQAKLTQIQVVPHGPVVSQFPPRRWRYSSDTSFASFNFKYRSRRALQSLCMIPRTPSPEPPLPIEERAVEELTPEEIEQLLAKQEERATQQIDEARVKDEFKREYHAVDDDDVEFVSDRPCKAAKQGEVIDLCDDDMDWIE